jgi:DNA-damage-inducible protein D
VDIIEILTETSNPRRYWYGLKRKLTSDGSISQLYNKIVQLKIEAPDGQRYVTDCANTEGRLNIIMSIPSPKAEHLKLWFADVSTGYIEKSKKDKLPPEDK